WSGRRQVGPAALRRGRGWPTAVRHADSSDRAPGSSGAGWAIWAISRPRASSPWKRCLSPVRTRSTVPHSSGVSPTATRTTNATVGSNAPASSPPLLARGWRPRFSLNRRQQTVSGPVRGGVRGLRGLQTPVANLGGRALSSRAQGPPVAQLQVALFGGVETRLATGQVLSVPRQIAAALLAYLMVRPARWHTREALCALLWPDVAATEARHRLRQTLLMLRRSLAPGSRSWLLSTGDGIAVAPDKVAVDVVAFEQALAEGTPGALACAASLYRGDFLAGLAEQAGPFEEWVLSERERLRELALEALGRLLAHQVDAPADSQAVHTATRLLALDGTLEAVHRTLMRLHARQGRRGAALRQYQSCVAALRRDLGVE